MDRAWLPDSVAVESYLESMPLFHGVPAATLKGLIDRLLVRQHSPDQLLLIAEDWGNSVYFILQGWVKVRAYTWEGKEITLNILGPGDIFGEMALLLSAPRSSDVLSLTTVVLGCFPATDFMSLVQNEAVVGLRLAQLMARRLQQLNRRLQMRQSDSMARVADILLFLAEGQGKSSADGVEIPRLSHQELASLSGLTRETVSRVLQKLDKKGLVERSSQAIFCLPDLPGLEAYLS